MITSHFPAQKRRGQANENRISGGGAATTTGCFFAFPKLNA